MPGPGRRGAILVSFPVVGIKYSEESIRWEKGFFSGSHFKHVTAGKSMQ